jgi:hypothetical protein
MSSISFKASLHKLLKISFASLIIFQLIILTLTGNGLTNNLNPALSQNKVSNAQATPAADLIIGTVDTGTQIEMSVCIKATAGTFHLTNVSHWVQFNNTALTPVPSSTFIEKGAYGGSNGYGPLKWQQLLPAPVLPDPLESWTLRLDFLGDGVTPGQQGVVVQSTAPELYGKVKFNKIPNSTASKNLSLTSNRYLTFENSSAPLAQTVYNVGLDCRNSVCPANTTSVSGYNILPNGCANVTSTPCPSGSYLNQSVCTSCSAGNYCPLGALVQTPCTVGYYCVANVGSPAICPSPKTSLSSAKSLSECFLAICANGATNFSTCDNCPASQYYFNGTCSPCRAGNYCPANSNRQTQCAAGFYCQDNAAIPVQCPTNKTSPAGATSLASCYFSCNANSYLEINTCLQCPISKPYSPAGSTGISSCTLTMPSSGGVITIGQTINSSISAISSIQSVNINIEKVDIQSGLGSKASNATVINDPYVCGVGNYGNIPNAKEYGVDHVNYDFYRENSENSIYSFRLKLNNKGDFFLPISKNSNIIMEGKYRVVYFTEDKNGDKIKGEFVDFITDNCGVVTQSEVITSVRTGGSEYVLTILTLLALLSTIFYIAYKKNKNNSFNSVFGIE